MHSELDDFICFRIKFHLLLFSHSRIKGISDRGVLYESLFRRSATFERILLPPSYIPCSWRWHVPLKCQCPPTILHCVKTEDNCLINACCKSMDTWEDDISPELELPDAVVVTVNNNRLRNVK
jgi:hypothetical protein